jgi:hypothetical protein
MQLRNLDDEIVRFEHTIARLAQRVDTARRPMSIPGFGPIIASAMDLYLFLEKRLVFTAFPRKNRPEPTVTVGPLAGHPVRSLSLSR